MSTSQPDADLVPARLHTSVVVRVREDACEIWNGAECGWVRFATGFPSPRVERVSPGHLVAIATGVDGAEVVVWRWYDAVVQGLEADGSVRLWESAHGEVIARPRESYEHRAPGSRAYASAGLPGAEWWVAGGVTSSLNGADVDLDDVETLYAENDLWSEVFASDT